MARTRIGQFIGLFLAVILVAISVAGVTAAPRPPASEIRGVWLTNVDSQVLFSTRALKRAIARLADLKFNTLYPTVWQGGYTLYPSEVTQRTYGVTVDPEPGFEGRDMLAEAIAEGHSHGMTVIPWFEFGFWTTADGELAQTHPDWLTQRDDGTIAEPKGTRQIAWLNPFHPEVQQFMLDMVAEAVTKYDLDGIQFDDHFGLPANYGYDEWTANAFWQSLRGLDLSPEVTDQYWNRWRLDRLTEFVEKLHATVKEIKPDCIISLSPNPFLFSHTKFLQDWFNWQQAGWIDEIVLQVYRSDLQSFTRELSQRELEIVRQKTPVAIGILTGLKNRSTPIQTIEEQVREARRQGYAGVSYFFYESLWQWARESRWQRSSRLRQLFAAPVTRTPVYAEGRDRSQGDLAELQPDDGR